jgi:hypothetical protein
MPSELGTGRRNRLTTECCRYETTELEDEFIAAGLIDYVDGEWINFKKKERIDNMKTKDLKVITECVREDLTVVIESGNRLHKVSIDFKLLKDNDTEDGFLALRLTGKGITLPEKLNKIKERSLPISNS